VTDGIPRSKPRSSTRPASRRAWTTTTGASTTGRRATL